MSGAVSGAGGLAPNKKSQPSGSFCSGRESTPVLRGGAAAAPLPSQSTGGSSSAITARRSRLGLTPTPDGRSTIKLSRSDNALGVPGKCLRHAVLILEWITGLPQAVLPCGNCSISQRGSGTYYTLIPVLGLQIKKTFFPTEVAESNRGRQKGRRVKRETQYSVVRAREGRYTEEESPKGLGTGQRRIHRGEPEKYSEGLTGGKKEF